MMIRELEWKDMDDLIANYYSYYEELKERPDFGIIFYQSRPNFVSEIEWFSSLYKGVEEGNVIAVVAVEDGKVVGLCDVHRIRPGSEMSHVGLLGIAVKKGYRGNGLGEQMMKKIIDLSRSKFEILKLEVFSVNSVAIKLYRRSGFVEYGTMPNAIKRGNYYFDSIYMYYRL
jgi:RimJ/RimL family protein N-acetyltransferase